MRTEKLIESIAGDFAAAGIEELLRRSRSRLDRALKHIRRTEVAVGVVKSPLGDLLVVLGSRGIMLNHYLLDASDLTDAIAQLRLAWDPVEDPRATGEVGDEIRRYLSGESKALRQKVDLTLARTPFHRRVLDKLREIPRGALISYQALGAAAGAPKAARAVGNAMHNNPVPIYVPCHRVIASDGGIGGYGGGVPRKLQLLRSEGFAFGDAGDTFSDRVVLAHKRMQIFCRRNCRCVAAADRGQILFFADPSVAQRAGMRPCKICRPASESRRNSLNPHMGEGESG
jgi:methylated-DNA-[protein]-cysteine S-methyltransferase